MSPPPAFDTKVTKYIHANLSNDTYYFHNKSDPTLFLLQFFYQVILNDNYTFNESLPFYMHFPYVFELYGQLKAKIAKINKALTVSSIK